MALDAQSNWDVEMPQLRLSHRQRAPSPSPTPSSAIFRTTTREIPLPVEIISLILLHLPIPSSPSQYIRHQHTLWAFTLISRSWYTASIALLYARPYLHGGNFHLFANTICPSKIARIRHSTLSPLVRRLDMGSLVHNASKSLTARLLGRLKGNIEEFVAPQASFAVNSFAALSKCVALRELNLSLISASIPNKQLFQTLAPLQHLETLFFPRSSGYHVGEGKVVGEEPYTWPPRLKTLHLAGGVDDHFLLTHLANIPPTLERLSIQHCSQVYGPALVDALERIGPQLRHLMIRHPMSKLSPATLDLVLTLCPCLVVFRISADYISNGLFEFIPQGHTLQILDLDCSVQAGVDVQIDASEICKAVEDGRLKDLRSVRVNARLAWAATEGTRSAVGKLVQLLEQGEEERPLQVKTGVYVMKDE